MFWNASSFCRNQSLYKLVRPPKVSHEEKCWFFFFSSISLVPWHFFTLTCGDGFRQNHYLWVQQKRMDHEWSKTRNLKNTAPDHDRRPCVDFIGIICGSFHRELMVCLSSVGTKLLKFLCAKQWHPEWTMGCASFLFPTVSLISSGPLVCRVRLSRTRCYPAFIAYLWILYDELCWRCEENVPVFFWDCVF